MVLPKNDLLPAGVLDPRGYLPKNFLKVAQGVRAVVTISSMGAGEKGSGANHSG